MNDPELLTAASLRVCAHSMSEETDRKLLLKAADELEDLVQRLDALWQAHRWCGDK